MNSHQRQELINGLTHNKIDFKPATGGEIAMRCPRCSPHHDNRRRTLSINTQNDRWQCFRCPDGFKGRKKQLGRLLKELGLEHLTPMMEADEVLIEDDSLEKIRRRLLMGEPEPASSDSIRPLQLPEHYRTDWDSTTMGRMLYRYLVQERRLDEEVILKYRLGYCANGPYAGGIVLPVFMRRVLRFWQVRRVMLNDNAAKYDSPKVDKRSVLFDYDSIEPENVVVVEGVFDKLALGGSGVAILGKQITDEQIALLQKKSVKTVTVLLDGEAWREAKQLAYEIRKKLWGVQLVKALRLPFGQDPGKLGRTALARPVETLRLRA